MSAAVVTVKRCAVYCRVSTDERLDQSFNSIDAQREAGLAFIASQAHEGWTPLPETYEDPGYSGGNMERPALKRLMADIEAGKIDVVVIYKIDRLSRSLVDFARMVDVFDRCRVSFSAVTQQINSATSMGRLMLNVLLSFAQFEREVTAERIRDKIAASKRKGIWMGGVLPLGYDVDNRKLVINKAEAKVVRHMFERFVALRSVCQLSRELDHDGYRTKARKAPDGTRRPGAKMDKRYLSKALRNPIYIGELRHKGATHPGEHEPIIDRKLWDAAQAIHAEDSTARGGETRMRQTAGVLLRGLVYGPDDDRYQVSFSQKKNGKRYWYYLAKSDARYGYRTSKLGTIPAQQLDAIVTHQLIGALQSPETTQTVWQRVQAVNPQVTEPTVVLAIRKLGDVWQQLFAEEQQRIARLLIERVQILSDGIDIQWRESGWIELAGELAPATIGGEMLEMEDA